MAVRGGGGGGSQNYESSSATWPIRFVVSAPQATKARQIDHAITYVQYNIYDVRAMYEWYATFCPIA